jgi:hypothetical protein
VDQRPIRHDVAYHAAYPGRCRDTREEKRVRQRIDIAWAQEAPAAPVTLGDVTVTPRTRALVIRLPQGGFVWNRPTALTVQQAGTVRHLPVVDVTRLLQLALLALAAAIAVAVARRWNAERR